MNDTPSHEELAESLRTRVLTSGIISPELRAGAMDVGAGTSTSLHEPYRTLAAGICGASYRVTGEQVGAVRAAAGSDKAAFEVVLSASIGAGLARWDAALRAIEGADDAAS